MRELYGLRDDAAIARELGRSVESVRRTAATQFDGEVHSGPWTEEEQDRLRRYLGATSIEVIARILGRPEPDVRQQVDRLGRVQQTGRWSRDDVNTLRRIYGTRTDEDLARIFGRSVESIRRMAARFALAKDKAFVRKLEGDGATRMPRWADDELEVLRELYPTTANLEIARRLDRSVKSVVSKAHHLGLKKSTERLREMGRENVSLRYGKG